MQRVKKNIIELTRMSASECLNSCKMPVKILADNIRSLHNVGSLLRTADSLGIDEVIMGGITGTPPHPEISKTALGAEQSVKWRKVGDSLEECLRLQNQGWHIYCLEQAHGSINIAGWTPAEDEKVVIVVGNEVEGVDQRIVEMCDECLEIPQQGAKHSMNVAVSAGIALWQAVRTKIC